jgi:hypothetical protein
LQKDNQLLESIQVDFSAMVRQLREQGGGLDIICFFKELPMLGAGIIVSKDSASFEGYASRGIHANHRDMAKFATSKENGFKKLLQELTRWTSEIGKKDHIFDTEDRACLRDPVTTNPRDDKDRIEKGKGGLLGESYRWILDNDDFKQWRYKQHSQLLWIKCDPGRGKTMLLCGVIDELTKSAPESAIVSFFFCQATDVRINHATAVLRGLIFILVDQQPSLIFHIRQLYDKIGKKLFEDQNAWVALSKIFVSILEDPLLSSTYLIIDALEDCTTDRALLLDLVAQKSSVYPYVKWIVSSRNWPDIEEGLNIASQKLKVSLELNEKSVAEAVTAFIHHKVQELTV